MRDSILTCICQEKDGPHLRNVYPMELSLENLKVFWEKAKKFKTIFGKDVGDNFDAFVKLFIDYEDGKVTSDCLMWVIDDFVGVYYMSNIFPSDDALLHYTFFDRKHHGRYDITVKMLNYVFSRYRFRRLSVEIPMYATEHSFYFIESLGFRQEGRKRDAIIKDGEQFDVKLFGILPEEVGKPIDIYRDSVPCLVCGYKWPPKKRANK
jgi:RimJ/RimL family protein N-acetyltransferase